MAYLSGCISGRAVPYFYRIQSFYCAHIQDIYEEAIMSLDLEMIYLYSFKGLLEQDS